MKKVFIIVMMVFIVNSALAQNDGIAAVKRFGYSLNKWCDSKDPSYREDVIKECAGRRGRECLVNDDLMREFVSLLDLGHQDTYMLDSYLRGFQTTMRNGKTRVQITDVETIKNPSYYDERFIQVSCKVTIIKPDGKEHSYNDQFYIRKIGQNKISKISPYLEQKNEQTGRTEVVTNTSDLSYDRIANGDYNSIEVFYGYSSHYPLNIGVTTNFSYFNIGVEYGQNFSDEPLDIANHTNFATSEIAGKYFYLMGTPGIFLRRASIDCGLGAVFTSNKYQSVYTSDSKKNVTFMMKPKVTFHIPIPLNFSSNNEKMYISPHIAYQYVPKYGKLNCWEIGIGVRIRFETY